ncbi:MAG: arsinothricin resistance N-acetyltransferase ArsN1 family B [Planctomycetota bacterium]
MKLSVRTATDADASAMAEIYAPLVRDTATSFELEPPDEAEFRNRMAETLPDLPWLVCERENAVIGYAYAGLHRKRAAYRWTAEVSVYVRADARRAGVARTLYEKLFADLLARGYCTLLAGVTLPNPASVALHESLGFTPVGVYREVGYKLGAWHDVGWWQLRIASPSVVDPENPSS